MIEGGATTLHASGPPHCRISSVIRSGYWLDDIAQQLTNDAAFAWSTEDRINGLCFTAIPHRTRKSLDTSSRVYDMGTGTDDSRVLDQLLDEVQRHAASRGIHLLTCKVQPLQFAAIHALSGMDSCSWTRFSIFSSIFRARLSTKSVRPQRLDGLQVRLANPDDLPDLLALTETAFAKHFGDSRQIPKCPLARAQRYVGMGALLVYRRGRLDSDR